MEGQVRSGDHMGQLQALAATASDQYFDLERADSEVMAWMQKASREGEGEESDEALLPSWDPLFHLQPHLQHQLQHLTMDSHSDSQWQHHHHDQPQGQPYYPPPPSAGPASPGAAGFQPYYHTHSDSQLASPPNEPSFSSYGAYPNQYASPPALSPSSSTDPELKRLRNTAASARFRAKKKRREQSLERNAKEKRDTLAKLEQRIQELEAENRFLKGLIFDKEKLDGVKSELERVRALKRGLEMEDGEGEGEGERDDGVGT